MKKTVAVLLTILMLFSLLQGASSRNVVKGDTQPIWPMLGYNAQHTGQCSYDTSKNDGTLKWKFEEDLEIRSSPAIASDGTVYVGSEDKHLYAINPDGSLKWKYKADSEIYSSPAISKDGTIYFCSYYKLYALNPDGSFKWQFSKIKGNSPVVDSTGTIYLGSSNDIYFLAINPNGSVKWQFQAGSIINSSPAISEDGMIYVGSGRYLYALNSSGSLEWQYETYGTIYYSPAIAPDNTIYVGSNDNYLYAINPDGTRKWRTQIQYLLTPPAIALDGTIYVGSSYYGLYAITPGGIVKWIYVYDISYGIYSFLAISSEGTIYFVTNNNCLYAVKSDGTFKWRFQASGNTNNSSPAISSDGTIYVGSSDHYLYAIGGSPDFSISVTPSSRTITQGGSTTYTVILIALNGFNSSVSLSATGLPTGAVYSFNPPSLVPTNSSTLTISTSSSTPVYSYTITINASCGGRTRTTLVALNVQSITPPDLNMHINAPLEGEVITTPIFDVRGDFDGTPPASDFKLVVKVAGVGEKTYPFQASGQTWGPVTVNMTDFPGMLDGIFYAVSFLALSQNPTIPPYQTGIRNIIWNNSNASFFTLHIPSGWALISVPFDTDASILSCPLIYYFNGSMWQTATTLHPGIGYLVLNSSTPKEVSLTGTPHSSPFSLSSPGSWQLIG